MLPVSRYSALLKSIFLLILLSWYDDYLVPVLCGGLFQTFFFSVFFIYLLIKNVVAGAIFTTEL